MKTILINYKGTDYPCLLDESAMSKIEGKKLSIDKMGYVKIYISKIGKKYLHRYLMDLTDPKIEIDHINHNRRDNRLSNLRICNHKENTRSKIKALNTSSIYYGVSFNKKIGRYASLIETDGKRKSLKTYRSEVAAAVAYDINAIKYHKNFATLNFPELIDVYNSFIADNNNQINAAEYLGGYIPSPEEQTQINYETDTSETDS